MIHSRLAFLAALVPSTPEEGTIIISGTSAVHYDIIKWNAEAW
jgi:hypothetical protein